MLDGGIGINVLDGGAGDDTIQHKGLGVDHIDGGSGVNTLLLDMSAFAAGQNVDLTSGSGTLSDGSTFMNIEVLTFHGGSGADVITGGVAADSIGGGAGNDVLRGAGGDDSISGGDGTDTALFSGNAADYSVTKIGLDSYTVTDLRAGATDGTDALSSIELLGFADRTVNLSAQVSSGVTVQGTNGDNWIGAGQTPSGQPATTDAGDTVHGNGGDDHITGGAGADALYGDAGNDFVNGGAGDDFIYGGLGHDELTGGLGADTFVFLAIAEAPVGAGYDVILDFSQAQGDVIDLSAIDAIPGGANDAFSYVNSFSGTAGQLVATHSGDGYLVQGDTTGDGLANFAIQVNTNAALSKAAFTL